MDNNKKVILHLLADSPADIDEFKSHDNVANSISELILEETEGKSIALTGSWGSGKSSIIKMLKTKLDGKCFVFEFNAWAHEGSTIPEEVFSKH